MLGICGLSSGDSSMNARLARSLGSKLQARMGSESGGSLEYVLTWKREATTPGRWIYRLRASGRRTSGSGCGGWPSPDASSGNGGRVSAIPEARVRPSGSKKGFTINDAAATVLAGWGTPRANDAQGSAYCYSQGDHSKPVLTLTEQAQVVGWNTPRATDGTHGGPNQANGALSADAARAGWATPAAQEPGGTVEQFLERKRLANKNGSSLGESLTALGLQAQTTGATSNGSSAESPTGRRSRGVLNPALPLWLMAYPLSWLMAAPAKMRRVGRSSKASATPSSSRSRRSSSKA